VGKLLSLEENMLAMAKRGLVEEAMQLYEKSAPKRFIRDHRSMRKSLTSIHERNVGAKPSEYKLKDFRVPPKLKMLFEA
jgi:hypothetical protein